MLGLIFNLSLGELVAISVVALLVFGRKLPEVAGQAAGFVQRMRRSLSELRRESGIDREIWEARRQIEQALPRDLDSETLVKEARLSVARKAGLADALAKGAGAASPAAETPADAPAEKRPDAQQPDELPEYD